VEPDISILRKSGHFYFALTLASSDSEFRFRGLGGKLRTDYLSMTPQAIRAPELPAGSVL
jgi:hypothetical protein